MSYDKVVDSTILDGGLTTIANAIRQKHNVTGELKFPDGMTNAILHSEDTLEKRLKNTMIEYSNTNVTEIPDYGFVGQSKLENVNLPNLKTIGKFAFLNCANLCQISFPLLKTISEGCFKECSNLTKFITNSTFDSYIPDSVFERCINLKKIDFYHVEKPGIGVSALSCTNLETIIIRNTDYPPPLLKQSFGEAETNLKIGTCYIYVPKTMVDFYKSVTNWSLYAEQIRAIEDYPDITGG